jgi:hypothetical protein
VALSQMRHVTIVQPHFSAQPLPTNVKLTTILAHEFHQSISTPARRQIRSSLTQSNMTDPSINQTSISSPTTTTTAKTCSQPLYSAFESDPPKAITEFHYSCSSSASSPPGTSLHSQIFYAKSGWWMGLIMVISCLAKNIGSSTHCCSVPPVTFSFRQLPVFLALIRSSEVSAS